MQKKRRLTVLFCILTLLWICFIWFNSLKPGKESGELSAWILEFVNGIFSIISISVSHLFIRKLAHFLEFAVLGVLLSFLIYFFFELRLSNSRKRDALLYLALPTSFLVASVDETIQLFVPGRAGLFSDVMIDTSGALCAITVFFLSLFIRSKLKNKKSAD